ARIRVRNLDGRVIHQQTLSGIDLAANHATRITAIPKLANRSGTYFVELDLSQANGTPVSRNVYWLSTRPDTLRWKDTTWQNTPTDRYADLTALQTLPQTHVDIKAHSSRAGKHA